MLRVTSDFLSGSDAAVRSALFAETHAEDKPSGVGLQEGQASVAFSGSISLEPDEAYLPDDRPSASFARWL